MSQIINADNEKTISRAIPMSLATEIDLSEYRDPVSQPFDKFTEIPPKKNQIYVHFEGKYRNCLLIKTNQVDSIKISAIANDALNLYNSCYDTNLLTHEVRYYLSSETDRNLTETFLWESIPTITRTPIDLIISIPSILDSETNSIQTTPIVQKKKEVIPPASPKSPKMVKQKSEPQIPSYLQDNMNVEDDAEIEKKKYTLFSPLNQIDQFIGKGIVLNPFSFISASTDHESSQIIQKGEYFQSLGDFKTAAFFYASSGIQGISHVIRLAQLTNDSDIIGRTSLYLEDIFPSEKEAIAEQIKKISEIPQTPEEALKILLNPKALYMPISNCSLYSKSPHNFMYSKQELTKKAKMIKFKNYKKSDSHKPKFIFNRYLAKRLIRFISKKNPELGAQLCLKYPDYLEFLPYSCHSTEVLDSFTIYSINEKLDSAMLLYLSELFIRYNLHQYGSQIGFNVVTATDIPEFAYRRICWAFLISGQYSTLYFVFIYYFNKFPNRSIGGLDTKTILSKLAAMKKKQTKSRPGNRSIQTIVDPLDPSDLNFMCIILDMAIYLFLNGNIDEYNDISAVIGARNKKFFEQTGVPPEFELYACVDNGSGNAINDNVKIDCALALGDESTLLYSFKQFYCFEKIIPYPVPKLTIYELRHGAKSLKKAAFWRQFIDITYYRQIVLILGHNDLLYSIPKLLQKDFTTIMFLDAVKQIIEMYLLILNKIHITQPKLQIYVHPVSLDNENLRRQASIFNEQLRKSLPSYAQMIPEEKCRRFFDPSVDIP